MSGGCTVQCSRSSEVAHATQPLSSTGREASAAQTTMTQPSDSSSRTTNGSRQPMRSPVRYHRASASTTGPVPWRRQPVPSVRSEYASPTDCSGEPSGVRPETPV